MTDAEALIKRAKQIRRKLRFPPNAVIDDGIDLSRKSITCAVVELPPKPRPIYRFPINVDNVLAAVSRFYNIPVQDIKGPVRFANYVKARRMVVLVTRRMVPTASLSAIARKLNKDHTTILHARNVGIKSLENPEVLMEVQLIEQSIAQNHA